MFSSRSTLCCDTADGKPVTMQPGMKLAAVLGEDFMASGETPVFGWCQLDVPNPQLDPEQFTQEFTDFWLVRFIQSFHTKCFGHRFLIDVLEPWSPVVLWLLLQVLKRLDASRAPGGCL